MSARGEGAAAGASLVWVAGYSLLGDLLAANAKVERHFRHVPGKAKNAQGLVRKGGQRAPELYPKMTTPYDVW